jgi:hypothetical protein
VASRFRKNGAVSPFSIGVSMTKQREHSDDVDSVAEQAVATGRKVERTKRSRRRFWIAIAISPIVLPLLSYGCIRIANPHAGPQNIRVCPETTWVTEPVDGEGFVDYLAAINQRSRRGITPENDAGVLLFRALGRYEDMPETYWDEFHRELGIEPLPAQGNYFVEDARFAEQHPEMLPVVGDAAGSDETIDPANGFDTDSDAEHVDGVARQLNRAAAESDWRRFHEVLASIERSPRRTPRDIFELQCEIAIRIPWRASDFPAVAAWLKQNQTPLDLAAEASRRPRFFFPLISTTEYMPVMSSQPRCGSVIGIGHALCTRAMLRLGEGDAEGAWEDVLAVHRLARLIGQQQTLMSSLCSYAMDEMAVESAPALACSRHVTPELHARIQKDLSALGPATSIADSIDVGERLLSLDMTICVARYGGIDGGLSGDEGVQMSLVDRWNNTLVDWNEVLIAWNDQYDRIVSVARMPRGPGRDAATKQLEAELDAIRQRLRDPSTAVSRLVIGSQRTKFMQSVLFTFLIQSVHSVIDSEEVTSTQLELARLSYAMAAYRQDHGEYPASLAELTADYTTASHIDPFSGGPYVFKTESNGFVLYSVGEDKRDDGGITREEADEGGMVLGPDSPYRGYDYPVRVPPRVSLGDLGLLD